MKLQDLDFKNPVEKSQKVFESYFNKNVDFAAISAGQAKSMLTRVRALINEHRNSSRLHTSERNPTYLKLMVMEQALSARVEEGMLDAAMKDPKTKQVMQKAQRGQNLTPDEQKIVTALAMAPKNEEETKKKPGKKVMESEVQ